jgi:hypothetical protein
VADLELERGYRLDGDRLLIDETLTTVHFDRPIHFRYPPGARDLLCDPDCDWDMSADRLTFHPRGAAATIRIRFEL